VTAESEAREKYEDLQDLIPDDVGVALFPGELDAFALVVPERSGAACSARTMKAARCATIWA
jgi:hypothetical protein